MINIYTIKELLDNKKKLDLKSLQGVIINEDALRRSHILGAEDYSICVGPCYD